VENKKYSKPVVFHDISLVTFKALTQKQIKHYLSIADYRKFAGGYALFVLKSCQKPTLRDLLSKEKYSHMHSRLSAKDDHDLNVVEEIAGSISNVIGLSLEKIIPLIDCQNTRRVL
jgi:predicted house-cleaning NTP pyrophosphatase (Maf/HAM1 superfamily)